MAQNSGFNNASFNNRIVGPNGVANRHVPARTQLLQQADAILRQPPGAPAGVQGLAPAGGVGPTANTLPNPLSYEEIPIFNGTIANYLAQIFAFTVSFFIILLLNLLINY